MSVSGCFFARELELSRTPYFESGCGRTGSADSSGVTSRGGPDGRWVNLTLHLDRPDRESSVVTGDYWFSAAPELRCGSGSGLEGSRRDLIIKYSLSSQLFEPVLAPAAGCSDAVPLADHPDQDVEAAEGFHAMSHQFGAEGKPGHTGT